MMNNVFTVADTHFGHRKVTEFRPFATVAEHDRVLVEAWNAVVKPKDTVWHLGDVYLGGRDNHQILGSLNGIKHLIKGNHDVYPIELYQMYFRRIMGVFEYHDAILSHIPVHPCQSGRFRVNVHGHLHDKRLDDPFYQCVSVEQTGWGPLLMSTVLGETPKKSL